MLLFNKERIHSIQIVNSVRAAQSKTGGVEPMWGVSGRINTASRRRTATTGTTSAAPHAIGHNVNRVQFPLAYKKLDPKFGR